MNELNKTENTNALLVGVDTGTTGSSGIERSLDELEDLAKTNGFHVLGRVVQKLERIDGATFVGTGKLTEIAEMAEEMEAAGKRTLQESLEILASEDVQASAHLLHGPPVTKILEFAETFRPDMIVTGSRGMGAAKGALIGSVSSSLSKRASTSVLIVR